MTHEALGPRRDEQRRVDDEKAHWSGVVAMSVCAFALVASEFMPVSLLTPIAADLGITEGVAGQGIAISGLFAVLTSLSISKVASRADRRTVLLVLTAAMGLSGAAVALAPNVLVYMIGRALIGVVVGGFWSLSAATAIRLVPVLQVPRALAIFNGGNALATVLAAPLGSYLGSIVGWRGAFLCLVPISVVTLIWQWMTLPSMPARPRSTGASSVFAVFSALRRRPIALGMAACGLFFMGQFLAFTYVRPFLETEPRADAGMVSLVLLVIGAAGLLGTALIGRFLDRGMYRTLIVIPLLMAAIALGVIPAGEWIAPVIVLLGLWGLLATSAPVGWWSWVAKAMPDDAETGGGLMVAVIQMCIALGSTVGGLLYDAAGYRATFFTSALVLSLAATMTLVTARASRTRTALAA
jgi:predicted MFS family arabinose efflux permease